MEHAPDNLGGNQKIKLPDGTDLRFHQKM